MAVELVYTCDRCKEILTHKKLKEAPDLKYRMVCNPLDNNKQLEIKGFARTVSLCVKCCAKYEEVLKRFFK